MEDRLATLKNVIREPELDGWNLYLGNNLSPFYCLFRFLCHILPLFLVALVAKVDQLEQVTGDTTLRKRGKKQQAFLGFSSFNSQTSVES